MRLTLTEFVTLDGVYQAPGGPNEDTSGDFRHGGWLVPFFDDALGRYMIGIFGEVDAFVLGRKTYEIFAASWPKNTDPDDPVASRLNTLPKYVASRSLERPDWHNSTVLGGDVVAEVAELKDKPGRELQIHGSGALAQTLFDAGLIDTIRLIVFPVVLGSGKRLFAEGRTPSSFRLADVTSTPSGVTMQTLELTGPPEYGEVEVEQPSPVPIWFVDLASARDAEGMVAAIAQALGVRVQEAPLDDALRRHLRDRELLLVLDPFDGVPRRRRWARSRAPRPG